MTYQLITDHPPTTPIVEPLGGIRVISTLEIAVRDRAGNCCIVLALDSYGLNSTTAITHGEGYWAPPNLTYPVDSGLSSCRTVGKLRSLIEEKINREEIRIDMAQLAYSLGIRDATVVFRGEFVEVKRSPRTPPMVKAYHIMRWGVEDIDDGCLRDLADPDARRGLVFLPADQEAATISRRESASHGRVETWFLGKPINSNVDVVLESNRMRSELDGSAIHLTENEFYRKESGTVCVVDLAGYGSAVQYANTRMHTFDKTQSEISTAFRHSVAAKLEHMAALMGTTQVQTAGDGFIAALPDRVHADSREGVMLIFAAWREILLWIDELNSHILDAGMKIGSRIALHRGLYQYGRIGGLASFGSSFDGDSIIEVARLEQSLSAEMKKSEDEQPLIKRFGNYAVFGNSFGAEFAQSCIADLNDWTYLGEFELGAKEYKTHASVAARGISGT